MHASELRARAEAVVKERSSRLPQKIEYALNRAAEDGAFWVHYYDYVDPVHIETLKENGFQVEEVYSFKEPGIKISWK